MKTETVLHDTPVGEVKFITLTNAKGNSVTLSSLGAAIVSVVVPDRDGVKKDVVIGYPDAASYIGDGPCAGKTPGRYANRIAKGNFTLDGKTYELPINNGPNHLHGGPDGYQNRNWNTEIKDNGEVKFTLVSPEGDSGYPGCVKASVTYRWDDNDCLTVVYDAESDAPTVINLTNHSYFNLAGHDAGAVKAMNQILKLNCSRWLPTDDTLIPTGEMAAVAGTPMDFTEAKAVGSRIFPEGAVPSTETLITDFDAIRYGKGYDNCWISDAEIGENGAAKEVTEIATLLDPSTGRKLTVATDQPAAQVYGGNWVSGCPAGKDGAEYSDYCAVAIECQGCPDAPNKPGFPSQLLTPTKPYHRTIKFAFSAE